MSTTLLDALVHFRWHSVPQQLLEAFGQLRALHVVKVGIAFFWFSVRSAASSFSSVFHPELCAAVLHVALRKGKALSFRLVSGRCLCSELMSL